MDEIKGLSPETIETIAQIILVVVLGLASIFGIQLGRWKMNKTPDDETHFELKYSVISDKKADEIVRALSANEVVLREKIQAIKEFCYAVHNLHEGLKESRQDNRDFLRELRADIRDLIRDIK